MNDKLIQFICMLLTLSFAFAFNLKRFKDDDEYPKTLTADNFDDYVYNSDSATFVEFYSSFCGYCKRLAPRYKLFAESVKKWKPVIKVAKVNCEVLKNVKLCRKHKGTTFPTFKFFAPNRNQSEDGIFIPIENSDKLTTEIMQDMALTELTKYVTDHTPPIHWPKLKTLTPVDKSALFSGLKISVHRPLFIIVDSSDHQIGKKVALDLSAHKDSVDILNAKSSEELTNSLQAQSSVVLIRVKDVNNQKYEIIKNFEINPNWTHEEIGPKIDEMRNCIVSILINNYVSAEELKKEPPLTMVDLYNGIQHSLKHNIALRQSLTAEEMDVLRRFLIILLKHFPFQEDSHRSDIYRMSLWLNNRTADTTPMDISEYEDEIKKYNSLPAERPYIKCRGSIPDFRGYPCSLWSLFHMLTVAEYKQLLVQEKDPEVLYVMRDFIGTFFTCKYCARHFWNMSSVIFNEERLIYANSSVLWLWKGHNQANKRLQCDLSEDPKAPKIQFPSHISCPKCRDDNEEWDESAVFEYLVDYYSVENIVSSALRLSTFNFYLIVLIFVSMFLSLRNCL